MLNLLGIDPKTLETQCVAWGQKRFHAHSILRWVHQRGVDDFRKMTDLSRAFRDTLQTSACLASPPPVREVRSQDGTVKWLLGADENQAIETVFIPEIDRGTLCVSSQVGCLVNCPFCSTGQRGFSRNLAAHEIIGQVWHAKKSLGAYRLFESLGSSSGKNVPTNRVIDNVVFMGMGEPLQNYSALLASLRILLDDFAYGLSRRRVTVSTSGIVPMIDRLREDCPVALAISLHAPFDALRNQLVPINKKYPLNELIAACQRYLEKAPRKSITFEYVMLQEVNDKDIHLDALLSFARTMPCKFNLIPFNAVKGSGFQCSLPERIQLFANTLSTAGIVTTVRRTRGDDIDAACGQLAGSVINRIKNRRSATEQEVPFSRISSF